MAKDITIKNPEGTLIYYPKTVSQLVYDNTNDKTVATEIGEINEFCSDKKLKLWGEDLFTITKTNGYINGSGVATTDNNYDSCQFVMTAGHTYLFHHQEMNSAVTNGNYVRFYKVNGTTYTQVSVRQYTGGETIYTCPDDGNTYMVQLVFKKKSTGRRLNVLPSIFDITNSNTLASLVEDNKENIDGINDNITEILKSYRIAGFISPNNSYLAEAKEGRAYICMLPKSKSWYVPSGQTEGDTGACYLPPTDWIPSGEGNLPSSVTGWTLVDLESADYRGFAVLFGFKSGTWITHRLPYGLKSVSDILEQTVIGKDLYWDSIHKGSYINASGNIVNNSTYASTRKTLTNGVTYELIQQIPEGTNPTIARLFLVTRDGDNVTYTQKKQYQALETIVECPNDGGEYMLQSTYRVADSDRSILRNKTLDEQTLLYRVEQLESSPIDEDFMKNLALSSFNVITDYETAFYGIANNLKSGTDKAYGHGAIQVKAGQMLVIENYGSSNNVRYVFAQSNVTTSDATITPAVSGITTQTVNAGEKVLIIAPTDCLLLWNTKGYYSRLYGFVEIPTYIDMYPESVTNGWYFEIASSSLKYSSVKPDTKYFRVYDVSQFDKIRAYVGENNTLYYSIAFFSSNCLNASSFISGVTSNTKISSQYILDVPANAKYMSVSNNTEILSDENFYCRGILRNKHNKEHTELSKSIRELKEIEDMTYGEDLYTFNLRGFIGHDGNLNTTYNPNLESCLLELTPNETYIVYNQIYDDGTSPNALVFTRSGSTYTEVTYSAYQNLFRFTCPNDGNTYVLEVIYDSSENGNHPHIYLESDTDNLRTTIDQNKKDVFDELNYENIPNLYIFPEQATSIVYGTYNASYNHFVDSTGAWVTSNGWGSTRVELTPNHTYHFVYQKRSGGVFARIFQITGTEGDYVWTQVASKMSTTGGTWDYTCPDDGNIYVGQIVRYTTVVGISAIYDITDTSYTTVKEKIDKLDFGNTVDMVQYATRDIGYYIYSTGEKMQRTSEPTDITSVFTFDVTKLKQLNVYTAVGGTATYGIYAVAFYTSPQVGSNTLISGKLLYGGAPEAHWYNIEVPNNAVTACVTLSTEKLPLEELVIEGVYNFDKIAEELDEVKDVVYTGKRHLNICVLGNSYTCDSFMYVPFILQQYGITCNIHLYYRGSGSINTLIDEWELNTATSGGHSRKHFAVDTRTQSAWTVATRLSSKSMVELESDWDMIVVTNQSVASLSPSEFNNLDELVLLINASMPNPYKLCYSVAYTRNSSDNPTLSLQTQTNAVKVNGFNVVFPVGTAIFDARQNSTLNVLGDGGNLWGSDKVHLQDGIPCYIASLTIVEKIFRMYGLNHSVMQDQLRPTEEWCDAHNIQDKNGDACGLGGSDETLNVYLAQKAAIVANNNPTEILAI